MILELDDDNYPTDETLDKIREFSDWKNFDELFAAIKNIWTYPNYFSGPLDTSPEEIKLLTYREPPGNYYKLCTAGWSGNESIIMAMKENIFLTTFCWIMSARGGLHIYQVRKF